MVTINPPLKYFPMPLGASEVFKPRLLYLLAGMMATGHYKSIEDTRLTTDVTIDQLAGITGDSPYYIKDVFYKFIRQHPNQYVVWNGNYFRGANIKRNRFSLMFPKANFRIIWSDIFADLNLTPDEKGVIIGLYCLCVNNTYRFDLKDSYIATKLSISLNTWKKYKSMLEEKGIIRDYTNANITFVNPNFPNAKILTYDYLGPKKQGELIREVQLDEELIDQIYWGRLLSRTGS